MKSPPPCAAGTLSSEYRATRCSSSRHAHGPSTSYCLGPTFWLNVDSCFPSTYPDPLHTWHSRAHSHTCATAKSPSARMTYFWPLQIAHPMLVPSPSAQLGHHHLEPLFRPVLDLDRDGDPDLRHAPLHRPGHELRRGVPALVPQPPP